MNKKLEDLRKEYKNVPIPKELDEMITKALPQKKKKKQIYIWSASASAAALLLTATVNFSPDAAYAMSKVPFMKGIVEVVTFNEIKEEKNNININVNTPAISGLENKVLEDSLNEQYLEESKKLYEEFNATNKNSHLSINSDFEVVTDTPVLLSVRRSIETIQASGYVQNRYVTLDKDNEALITLKSLFENDQYINIISENIKEQMKQQMKTNPDKIYSITDDEVEPFTQIDPNQQFYISDKNKLVISFDEYEVAPGYMGAVEFNIPTEVISDILVGGRYIH